MRRRWASTMAAAVFLLAGCGGGTHGTTLAQPASTPARAQAVTTNWPLHHAAERWLRLVAEGRKREMWQHLVSAQCREWESLAQFRRWTRPPDPGLRFITYGRGDRGYVEWIYPAPAPGTGTFSSSPPGWQWVREGGHWKSNDCPRPDPGAR